MAINKVIYGNNTLIDLTGDTITPETLLMGVTAHDATGANIEGTMVPEHIQDTGWINLTISSGFSVWDTNIDLPQIRRFGPIVSIRGAVRNTSALSNSSYTTITTLATGFHPTKIRMQIPIGQVVNNRATLYLDATHGLLQIRNTTGSSIASGQYINIAATYMIDDQDTPEPPPTPTSSLYLLQNNICESAYDWSYRSAYGSTYKSTPDIHLYTSSTAAYARGFAYSDPIDISQLSYLHVTQKRSGVESQLFFGIIPENLTVSSLSCTTDGITTSGCINVKYTAGAQSTSNKNFTLSLAARDTSKKYRIYVGIIEGGNSPIQRCDSYFTNIWLDNQA